MSRVVFCPLSPPGCIAYNIFMALEPFGLLLVCALLAEVLGTMAGFGAATVLTPVASLFLDIKTAVAVVAVFHLSLMGVAFCGAWIGQHWVRRVPPARFKQVVLAMLFVMGWVLVWPRPR